MAMWFACRSVPMVSCWRRGAMTPPSNSGTFLRPTRRASERAQHREPGRLRWGGQEHVTDFALPAQVDEPDARDCVKELHSRAGPVRVTDMGNVASAHYPYIQKAEHRLLGTPIPNPQDLRGYLMSKSW